MASGLYVVQRLDLYNREQIDRGKNGDIFETGEQYAKIIDDWAAMDENARLELRNTVSATTRRYNEKEFTRSVVNVYDRAIYEYQLKHAK